MGETPPLVESRHGVGDGVVALTFDDGPSPWSGPILDLLAEHGGRATFFVLGAAVDEPDGTATVTRMLAEGHEVGNHTYTHHTNLPELDDERLRGELTTTSAAIERATGRRPRYWRAPHFRSDARVRAVAGELGLQEIGCSVITADYLWPGPQTAELVLEHLRPGDVVDLHDGRAPTDGPEASSATREDTVEAVRLILAEMTRRGLRSVTVSELLAAR